MQWSAEDGYFNRGEFEQYLQLYKQSTRLRFIQTTHLDEMQPPTITDRYPLGTIAGSRNYAVNTMFFIMFINYVEHAHVTLCSLIAG